MTALLAIALFILSAGFAKLMAVCVNWLCAQRLPKWIVITDKGLNLVLIIAYPVLLFWGFSTGQSSVFADPSNIGLQWWLLAALGAIGLVPLIRSTIIYWRYSPPVCEALVEANLVDLRNDGDGSWRTTLVQRGGRLSRLALLPANEQFTIEVSTKTYRLPGLPAEWNGLSIVHLTDFHFVGGVARRYFEIVCDQAASLGPDMFVFTGDLLDVQCLTDWIPETLGRLKAPLGQYFILGNHDWYHDPAATRREFARLGWTDLASRFVVLPPDENSSGRPLVLCGDETPWMGTHPDLADAPNEAFRILLSHTPDNIDWARRNLIGLMLAGHTHGGQIRLPILGPVYSPSRFDCRFASGVFWLDPTLMYVSRGVSGREPVRYNCPPEVTKLVLQTQPDAEMAFRSARVVS